MASLQELLNKRAELEQQIETTRRSERTEAIAKVKALMSEHALSVSDLTSKSSSPKAPSGTGAKVPAKYRNTATGDSWSGRGLQPKWLKAAMAAGRKIEDFAI